MVAWTQVVRSSSVVTALQKGSLSVLRLQVASPDLSRYGSVAIQPTVQSAKPLILCDVKKHSYTSQ